MKNRENHLPDGRHVATVGSDELWYLYRHGLAEEDMVTKELVRRPERIQRAVKKGYVPFGSGMRGRPNSTGAYTEKKGRSQDGKKRKKQGGGASGE